MGPSKQRPLTDDQHLGIEFEFHLPGDRGAQEVAAKRIMAAWLRNPLLKDCARLDYELLSWGASGCRNIMGYEASLLVKDDEYEKRLVDLLSIIEAEGGFVDRWCGIHVHVDVRFRTYEVIAKRLRAVYDDLFEFCEPGRKVNHEASGPCAIMHGRNDYKTVEVRCMDANFDLCRILPYIQFIVDVASNVESAVYAA